MRTEMTMALCFSIDLCKDQISQIVEEVIPLRDLNVLQCYSIAVTLSSSGDNILSIFYGHLYVFAVLHHGSEVETKYSAIKVSVMILDILMLATTGLQHKRL